MRNPGVAPPGIRTPNSNNCSAECAPERGNEPPARGNTLGEQGTKQAAPRQGADSKERIQLGRLQRGCQRHQTKVASHTEKPLGFSKWLERNTPHKNIACPWVGDIV